MQPQVAPPKTTGIFIGVFSTVADRFRYSTKLHLYHTIIKSAWHHFSKFENLLGSLMASFEMFLVFQTLDRRM
jgi:hypothetical protein